MASSQGKGCLLVKDRGKYFARTAILDAFVSKSHASTLWRGFMDSANLLRRGCFISIRNGHLTSF